uniref:peptidoglycan editing factor PgeF n=1 Tax=Bordetella sputigena TaxID=1416810 RepID=UPI0039F10B45
MPVVTGPRWTGVHYFCTTRAGGVGTAPHDTLNLGLRAGDRPEAVEENRRRLRALLPAEPLWLRQVHGTRVVDADRPAESAAENPAGNSVESEPAADAAVTTSADRPLAIMVADCLPVLIADTSGRALGAAHAGWRGLAGGVLENTLDALRRKRPDASSWQAWIGPGIGPAAFEVGADVLDAFDPADREAAALFMPRAGLPGKWLADLPALAELRLRRAGVREVHRSGLCTVADPGRFFSYRRDGQTGRMALLAWLSTRPFEYPH